MSFQLLGVGPIPAYAPGGVAFAQGINFSGTGYASGNNYAETSAPSYPHTTPQGNTVGFSTAVGVIADRDITLDERLRGAVVTFGAAMDYRFDLPQTGSYRIGVGGCDSTLGGNSKIEVFDTGGSLGVLCDQTGLTSSQVVDATNTVLHVTSWPTNQTMSTVTFSTQIAIFRIEQGGGVCKAANIYMEKT